MRRSFLVVALTTFLAALAVAPQAQGHGSYRSHYLHQYAKAKKAFGAEAVGRNIVKDGYKPKGKPARRATKAEVYKSLRTFKRWFTPRRTTVPVAYNIQSQDHRPVYSTRQTRAQYPNTARKYIPRQPSTAGGRYSIPSSIVQCESHGSYTARNPSSGAYGAYQILPSTAAAHGCSLSTPTGQDSCAREIWRTEGRGAWSC